ncbi:MAG: hypothetical protein LBR26_17745 [Prevotella sp.]|jgi:hypothetical protein|nr:hypothetical protein [Prevotella sp.]
MKLSLQKTTLCLCFSLFLSSGLQAQVVIGSPTMSEPAALLQIKEHDASPGTGEATASSGGLLLPRVALNSLSDITVLSPGADTDKKLELTGLLVYNINTSGSLAEGIYEWDGTTWNQWDAVSETSKISTQKAVVKAATLTDSNTPTVRMGVFDFRINPTDKKPQYRLVANPETSVEYWYNITRFWDEKNSTNSNIGLTFDSKSTGFNSTNFGWKAFHDGTLRKNDLRCEVWLADVKNSHAYKILFLIATSGLTTPIYAVIVTEY